MCLRTIVQARTMCDTPTECTLFLAMSIACGTQDIYHIGSSL